MEKGDLCHPHLLQDVLKLNYMYMYVGLLLLLALHPFIPKYLEWHSLFLYLEHTTQVKGLIH